MISAKNWFKGPVRMGTDEELEQLEEEEWTGFDLPADTQYEWARRTGTSAPEGRRKAPLRCGDRPVADAV